MNEQDKPKINLNFSESRNRLHLRQLKEFVKWFIILVVIIASVETVLDLTGILVFDVYEGLFDFFAIITSLILLLFLTVPIMKTQMIRKRSLSILKVALSLVSLQIIFFVLVYFAFPNISYSTNFIIYSISEVAYQGALFFIIGGYRFNRKFFSIHVQNGIRIRSDSNGYVESLERSDLLTQEIRDMIEKRIRGRISQEEFLDALSSLEPCKRELIISMVDGIEARLRKKYRW